MARKRKPKPTTPEDVLLFLLQHPVRKRLLRLYVEAKEPRSPKDLTVPLNMHLSNVSYHVRVLATYGALELVKTQPQRGSIEHFYKATSLVDDVPWGGSRGSDGAGYPKAASSGGAGSVLLWDGVPIGPS